MTIVDPSHPKAQMAFSLEGQAPSPTSAADDDLLPSYTAGPSISSGASQADTEPLFPIASSSSGAYSVPHQQQQQQQQQRQSPFEPETIRDLNPESRKKLHNELRDTGRDAGDYGFGLGEEVRRTGELLPSFGETEGEERATYQMDGQGNIISHDLRLNENPTALLRFLRLHASSPPALTVHIRGSHTEKKESTSWHTDHKGRRHARTTTSNEEVEDFSFYIDASPEVEQGLGLARGGAMRGLLYAVGGWEPVHRGRPWKTVERAEGRGEGQNGTALEGGIRLEEDDLEEGEEGTEKVDERKWRRVTLRERRRLEKEKRERDKRGLPGFIHPSTLVDMEDDPRPSSAPSRAAHPPLLFRTHFADLFETHSNVPLSLVTNVTPLSTAYDPVVDQREKRDEQVRKVVEAYCRKQSWLKELRIEKELYGWRWDLLEAGLRSLISRTHYTGTVQISFNPSPSQITIRPPTFFSHVFSLPIFVKLLLWLTLLYPVLLLISYLFAPLHTNLRVAFPLSRWRLLPGSTSITPPSHALALAGPLSPRRKQAKVAMCPGAREGEAGAWAYLVGKQEGEWLREWEEAIREGVRRGVRGGVKLEVELGEQRRTEEETTLGALRGYHE